MFILGWNSEKGILGVGGRGLSTALKVHGLARPLPVPSAELGSGLGHLVFCLGDSNFRGRELVPGEGRGSLNPLVSKSVFFRGRLTLTPAPLDPSASCHVCDFPENMSNNAYPSLRLCLRTPGLSY